MLKNSLLVSILIFVFSLALIGFLNSRYNFEDRINAAEYCESAKEESWFQQPINTISNYAYFFVGFLIIFSARKKDKSFISHHKAFSYTIGLTAILIGLTSMLFHGVYVHWTKTLDSSFVFIGALMLFLALYRLGLKSKFLDKTLWYDTIMILFASAMGLVFLLLDINAIYLVAGIIALSAFVIFWESIHNVKFKKLYILLALTSLLISYLIRQLDVLKIICDPASIIQLHGVWHIGTAISFWYFYMLLRSAKKTK